MYDSQDLDKILFLDIETVPQTASLDQLTPEMQQLWCEKLETLRRRLPDRFPADDTPNHAFRNGGGVYSEFAKIVCISVGVIHHENGRRQMRTKSFASDDEAQLLRDFATMASHFLRTPRHYICGHNIKEFDVPFICRRMLIHRIPLPQAIDVAGRKPWETSFLDTMELWKFGDYKSYTSLKLLCTVLGVATSKDDIDGSEVADVYYNSHDLHRIAVYCEKDVVATAQVFLRMNCLEPLSLDAITHVE